MKKITKKNQSKNLTIQKNKLRGLIAKYKSKSFSSNSSVLNFRQGVRVLLIHARVELEHSLFYSFLNWTKNSIRTLVPEIEYTSTAFDELTGVIPKIPDASLEREITWITTRIKIEAEKINRFRLQAITIENLAFQKNSEKAILALQQLEENLGSSLWSIQLHIALIQHAEGLEAQKQYTAIIRNIYSQGLLTFIAYHTSVRNEDKTSTQKYLEEIQERIINHKYFQPSVKKYMLYRLAHVWPNTINEFSEILKIEQSHPIIDIYETFIAALQEITKRGDVINKNLKKHIVKNLLKISNDISDYRIKKLIFYLAPPNTIDIENSLRKRDESISNALISENNKLILSTLKRIINNPQNIDPWNYIYASIAYSFSFKPLTKKRLKDIPKLISHVLNESYKDGEESFFQLKKFILNFNFFPTIQALNDFIELLHRSHLDIKWNHWFIGLNSSTIGIEDYSSTQEFPKIQETLTEKTWEILHNGNAINNFSLNRNFELLLRAIYNINSNNNTEVINSLQPVFTTPNPNNPLNIFITQLLLHAYFLNDNKKNIIEIFSYKCAGNGLYQELLPISKTLETYLWEDYADILNSIAAPIALFLHLSTYDHDPNKQDEIATDLRFATKQFLTNFNIDRPSEIREQLNNLFSKEEIAYFLFFVCTPNILDGARFPGVRNSREVLVERKLICQNLKSLFPELTSIFDDESETITLHLKLDEGRKILDSTRIHVEAENFIRWAERELSEHYARFSDLSQIHLETLQSFEDVMKSIDKDIKSVSAPFVVTNEADKIFYELVLILADGFLKNPRFGFDFYLSQRIRHGSFIGLIRSPLEVSKLITTKKSDFSGYNTHDYWLNHFTWSNEDSRELMEKLFFKFSTEVDHLFMHTKDNLLQIRSKEKPEGLIFLPLNYAHVALLKSLAKLDNFLSFLTSAFEFLWIFINPSLIQVQNYISIKLKKKLVYIFDNLCSEAKKIVENDNEYYRFEAEVRNCSVEVQRKLDEAASWFIHDKIEIINSNTFTLLEAVESSIANSLEQIKSFNANIQKNIENETIKVSAGCLVLINDIFLVALDNVRVHSEKNEPEVIINVRADEAKDLLSIDILSDTMKTSNKEKVLEEIRSNITKGIIGKRSLSEGRSGIIKLHTIISQSSSSTIDFGFVDNNKFQLKVTYPLFLLKAPQG